MDESCHDLVAAQAARVRDILQVVGDRRDGADESKEPAAAGRPLAQVDDGTVKGTWSAWNA